MSSTAVRNHQHLPIAIVGGGLGGLALAIGLLRHGVKVHIYEASPAFSEIGAGVTLGANATTALHLMDPRLF
jgi:salicylate hydroxylase